MNTLAEKVIRQALKDGLNGQKINGYDLEPYLTLCGIPDDFIYPVLEATHTPYHFKPDFAGLQKKDFGFRESLAALTPQTIDLIPSRSYEQSAHAGALGLVDDDLCRLLARCKYVDEFHIDGHELTLEVAKYIATRIYSDRFLNHHHFSMYMFYNTIKFACTEYCISKFTICHTCNGSGHVTLMDRKVVCETCKGEPMVNIGFEKRRLYFDYAKSDVLQSWKKYHKMAISILNQADEYLERKGSTVLWG